MAVELVMLLTKPVTATTPSCLAFLASAAVLLRLLLSAPCWASCALPLCGAAALLSPAAGCAAGAAWTTPNAATPSVDARAMASTLRLS